MLRLIADAMDIGKNIEAIYQKDVWGIKSAYEYNRALVKLRDLFCIKVYLWDNISTEMEKKWKSIAITVGICWDGNLIMKSKIPVLVS